MEREQNDSIWFMLRAIQVYFEAKAPDQRELIESICRVVAGGLRIEPYQGAGGVGLVSGWLEEIEEMEESQTSSTEESTCSCPFSQRSTSGGKS